MHRRMQAKDTSVYGPAFDAEYESLPESIRMIYSRKEYAWMPPERRALLVESECMPDVEED